MVQVPEEGGAATQTEDAPATQSRLFGEILSGLVGQMVTIVNAESYEHAPVGYQLKAGFYRGKVCEVGTDYLAVLTEMKRVGKETGAERVKQFIPFARVKRLSAMKTERILHI